MGYLQFLIIALALSALTLSCRKKDIPSVDYAGEMRSFIIDLSYHARLTNPDFIVIPQNGAKLLSTDQTNTNSPASDYMAAINGQGQEDLFFGYDRDDKASDAEFQDDIMPFLDLGKNNGLAILVTDYCSTSSNISESKAKNEAKSYVSFVATERALNNIPNTAINSTNVADVLTLADAQNFLYLINPNKYEATADFISALDATNYDAFIIDFFDYEGNALQPTDIAKLQTKPNGVKRLVIAYMSIGEAEDYRYYWQSEWDKRKNEPDWLYEENRQWKGNYKVFYWMADWQSLIFGSSNAYLDRIVAAGMDGVYLDIVDGYAFFEEEKNK